MAHTAPAVGISLSHNLAIPMAKFSDLFLRDLKKRSLAQIQWSSCVPDPMVLLILLPLGLATWSTQMLDSQPMSSRVHEIHRSLASCPPQMDGYDPLAPSSPHILVPHDFAHPILWLLPCELPSSRDFLISCHLFPQMDGYDLLATSPLVTWSTQYLGFQPVSPEFTRSPIFDTCPPWMNNVDLVGISCLAILLLLLHNLWGFNS
jgi:hypothetical protein